jgi:hypothetical protein
MNFQIVSFILICFVFIGIKYNAFKTHLKAYAIFILSYLLIGFFKYPTYTITLILLTIGPILTYFIRQYFGWTTEKNITKRKNKYLIITIVFALMALLGPLDSKLPERFIGTYIDHENPNRIIVIENEDGDFIEKENNYTVTGKFLFSDLSEKAGEPYFKITGFELKESNAPDGIHLIGCIDFNGESYSTFIEGEWPQFGAYKKTQAIHFGEGTYGGIGPLYFKK